MDQHLPSIAEVAKLTIYLVCEYDQEKASETTRFRISRRTLRKISGRVALRDSFLDEWKSALYARGWTVVEVEDHYGLIRTASIEGWPRIGSKRIADKIERV